MNVVPFHPDPRLAAIAVLFMIASMALALGLLLRRVMNRFLEKGDPRRFYVAQAILYGGMLLAIAVSMLR